MPRFLNLPHLPSVFHRKQDGECGRLGLLEVQRTFGSFLLVVVLRNETSDILQVARSNMIIYAVYNSCSPYYTSNPEHCRRALLAPSIIAIVT